MTNTIYKKRYDCNGIACEVENEDITQFIYEYKEKGMGYISCNRIAPGSKQDMKFEIQFTKGAIRYSLERLNEVLIYRTGNYGYETVISDENGWFNVGYENLKEIDAKKVVSAISNNVNLDIDFGFAAKVDRIIECVLESAEKKKWIYV